MSSSCVISPVWPCSSPVQHWKQHQTTHASNVGVQRMNVGYKYCPAESHRVCSYLYFLCDAHMLRVLSSILPLEKKTTIIWQDISGLTFLKYCESTGIFSDEQFYFLLSMLCNIEATFPTAVRLGFFFSFFLRDLTPLDPVGARGLARQLDKSVYRCDQLNTKKRRGRVCLPIF